MTSDQTPARPALLVLGMHRSGTSALAGVLGRAGFALPQELMPPTEHNPRGYFESTWIFRLNDALLAAAGSSWDDWRAFDADWHLSPAAEPFHAEAQEALAAEFPGTAPIVLKDPRICRLLPFWTGALTEAGFRPLAVCTHRPAREVGASLARRNGWPEARGLLLWLRHVLDAEAQTRGRPRVFVSYDGLLADWRGTLGRIAEAFDLALPRPLDEAAPEIEAFLSADLRHAPETPAAAAGLSDWIARPQEILDRKAAGEDRPGDRETLDRIAAEVAAAAPLLADLSGAVEEQGARLEREAALRHEAQTILQQERQRLDDLTAELQLQLHHRTLHVAELERHAGELAQQLRQKTQHAAELERHAEELAQQLRQQRSHAAELERHAGELSALTHELRQQVHHKGRHVAELERHAGALQTAVTRLEAERSALLDSASWRVTGPLRRVSEALRRPKS